MRILLLLLVAFLCFVCYKAAVFDVKNCPETVTADKGKLAPLSQCVEDYVKFCDANKASNLKKEVEIDGKLYYAYPADADHQTVIQCLYKNRENLADECKKTVKTNNSFEFMQADKRKQSFGEFMDDVWDGIDRFADKMAGKVRCGH